MTKTSLLLLMFLLFISSPGMARNDLVTFSFNEAVEQGYKDGILDRAINFKLAGDSPTNVKQNYGEFRSNKKTNAVGKSDETSCKWALLSVLKSFQARAQSFGGNAVINLKSNYKNRPFIDASTFQCGAGTIMVGVAMKGDVVKL